MKQRKSLWITLFTAIPMLFPSQTWGANNDDGTPDSDGLVSSEDMSVEEIDELIYSLYPQPDLIRIDPSTVSKNDSTKKNVPTRSVDSNTHVPSSVKVDTLQSTVDIPIRSGISPLGAKTYEIPIEVFPGMNGMQPEISLQYNSLSGMGNAGMGWNISGTSSIVRGGHDIYHDGRTDGMVMDVRDSFTLDGLRLIQIGQNREYLFYQTDRDNIKVTGHYQNNQSEQNRVLRYFEVAYPDGKKAVFGYPDNTSHQLTYPITELKDPFGNKITYEYDHALNNCYLTKISYNGASVSFSYALRRNAIQRYIGGMEIKDHKMLSGIFCRNGSSLLREYRLSYDYDNTQMELLNTIRLCSGGKYSNPLQFYYGEGNIIGDYGSESVPIYSYYPFEKPGDIRVIKGRFDYITGTDGIIMYNNSNPYAYIKISSTWLSHSQNWFKNYHDPAGKIILHSGLTDGMSWPVGEITKEAGFVDLICADLDGTQNEYIIKVNDNVVNGKDEVKFSVYRNTTYGLSELYIRQFSFNTVYTDQNHTSSIVPKYYYVGDFTGNGKMEILAVSANKPFDGVNFPTKCYLFDLANNSLLYEGSPLEFNIVFIGTENDDPDTAADLSDRILALDCDGDGKTELCLINGSGTHVFKFRSSVNGYDCTQRISSSELAKVHLQGNDLIGGDFNGDGLFDLMAVPKVNNGTAWNVWYSKGDGAFKKSYISGLSRFSSDFSGILAQDVNGDGIWDFVTYDANGFTTYIGSHGLTWKTSLTTSFPKKNSIIIPTSLSSRNTFTSLVSLKDGSITRYEFLRDDNTEGLLTGMVNCHGAVEKNRYEALCTYYNFSGNYVPGNNAVFPFVNVSAPIYTIAETAQYLNGTKVSDVNYMYRNAIMHKQGLGFCGFDRIIYYDQNQRNTYKYYDPFNLGVMTSEQSDTRQVDYEYNINRDSSGFLQILLQKKSEKDLLTNFHSTTDYSYDSYGYPVLEKTIFSDGIGIRKSRGYAGSVENDSLYYLGFMTDETITTTQGSDTYTERKYIATHSRLQPLKTILFKDGNAVQTTEYSYDAQGNPTLTKETPYTAQGRQSLSAYTPQGLVKSYSKDGRLTEYTYTVFGKVATQKDGDGTVSYTYDKFGRLTQTLNPNGSSEKTDYIWAVTDNNGVVGERRTVTGKPTELTIFDALAREVGSVQTLFNGESKSIDKMYDSYGNLCKVSVPYINDAPSGWPTYLYDKYGRKTSETDPVGRTTSYSYSSNRTTVKRNGISTTREMDSQGNLISVTDGGGKITYTLAADGQPVSISAPGNIVTSFTYDKYRRRTSITDPSLGTSKTTYNSTGQIASEVNANGQTVRYEYDSFERLTKKVTPEMTVEYKYDSKWRPTSITTSTGSSINYVYTSTGDVLSTIESAPGGRRLTRQRTYEKGLLKAMTYTSNRGYLGKETYEYRNGYLHTVTFNDTAKIYELVSEGIFGPEAFQTYNLQHCHKFHDNGLPKERYASKWLFSKVELDSLIKDPVGNLMDPAGTDGIGDIGPVVPVNPAFRDFFNESYEFDTSTGNLIKRTNNISKKSEIFRYDGLNRLIGYGTNGTEFTVTYGDNGNILAKSEVGSFRYDHSSKPYALTGVELADAMNIIPSWAQDITHTSFNRPSSITENGYTASFSYDHDYNRTKMEVSKDGSHLYSRYWLGDCLEIEEAADGTCTERLYLCGNYYKAPVVLVKEGSNTTICNIVRDYLGNIRMVLGQNLKVLQNVGYDPWGRLRPSSSFTPYTLDNMPTLYLGRGFTGHEHLPEFGLINMNARLYDPILARFLSPDPFVQIPDFSQNFNRFAYCLNNPLLYVDENGEFLEWILLGLFVATGVSGIVQHWNQLMSENAVLAVFHAIGYFVLYSAVATLSWASAITTGTDPGLIQYLFNPNTWKTDSKKTESSEDTVPQEVSEDNTSVQQSIKSTVILDNCAVKPRTSQEIYNYNYLKPNFLYIAN